MAYIPGPEENVCTEIPTGLYRDLDEIAKYIHEAWAEERINQGWVLGAERDDQKKTHPCLVPYEQLPEDEKKFDRGTVLATIKMLLALGYRIERG